MTTRTRQSTLLIILLLTIAALAWGAGYYAGRMDQAAMEEGR